MDYKGCFFQGQAENMRGLGLNHYKWYAGYRGRVGDSFAGTCYEVDLREEKIEWQPR